MVTIVRSSHGGDERDKLHLLLYAVDYALFFLTRYARFIYPIPVYPVPRLKLGLMVSHFEPSSCLDRPSHDLHSFATHI